MRVVFLDIDGVLCNGNALCLTALGRYDDRAFDPMCFELLMLLIMKYDLQVVLSSTWRLSNTWRMDMLDAAATGGAEGFLLDAFDKALIGRTPVINMKRGMEIEQYLNDFPEIENYIIIDDDIGDLLPHQLPYTIKTEFERGFNRIEFCKAEKIIEDLTNKESSDV